MFREGKQEGEFDVKKGKCPPTKQYPSAPFLLGMCCVNVY